MASSGRPPLDKRLRLERPELSSVLPGKPVGLIKGRNVPLALSWVIRHADRFFFFDGMGSLSPLIQNCNLLISEHEGDGGPFLPLPIPAMPAILTTGERGVFTHPARCLVSILVKGLPHSGNRFIYKGAGIQLRAHTWRRPFMRRNGIPADDSRTRLIDEYPQFPRELQVSVADPASKVHVQLNYSCIMRRDLSGNREIAKSDRDERATDESGENWSGEILSEIVKNLAHGFRN
jgi:hypothetical protein